MDLVMGIAGFVLAVMGGLILNILSNDLYDRCPRLARWLLERAVARLPAEERDRYREEWEAHLLECPTKLDQVRHALGAWWGARRIARMRPRERWIYLPYIIAGSALLAISQTIEMVGYIRAGAPWWAVVPLIFSIASGLFVVGVGLRIRKRGGDFIDLHRSMRNR
jgi:hypothetical protein